MCDGDLQYILQSVWRREVKIILERAEYIYPALKDGLVSVFVLLAQKKSCKCVFPENYCWEHFATNLIFLLICSTQLLAFLVCYHIVFGT
jgi:hypothetical protein